MLKIICGQDTISSRQYFTDLKSRYRQQGFDIEVLSSNNFFQLRSWMGESIGLFGSRKIFFIENLFKTIVKQNKRILKEISQIERDPVIKLIDWEDGLQAREIKTGRKNIREFKPPANIFHFLESVYPKNKRKFLSLLEKVGKDNDYYLIFFMLIKHTRNLILAKENQLPDNLQDWQKRKLLKQSHRWQLEKLISFYQSLYRIDIRTKTSQTPFSLKTSLDILACYYL